MQCKNFKFNSDSESSLDEYSPAFFEYSNGVLEYLFVEVHFVDVIENLRSY